MAKEKPKIDLSKSKDLLLDMNRAIIEETKKSGSSVGATQWFLEKINSGNLILPDDTLTSDLLSDKRRMSSKAFMVLPGRMFTFIYRPKTKSELPYYDLTPLIITLPVEKETENILGINLHYIDPELRGELIDRLLRMAHARTGEKMPPKGVGHFRVNYDLLKTRRFVFGVPCIRSYDPDKIIGRPILIPSNEWGNAVSLPFENFVKAKEARIWVESRRAMRKFIQSITFGDN